MSDAKEEAAADVNIDVRNLFKSFLNFRFEFRIWHAMVLTLIAVLLAGWSQGLIVIFVLFGAALLILLGTGVHRTTPHFKHSLEGMAALLSCLALFAAAYWYFIERRGVPKVNVESNIQAWPIGGRGLFVRVETALQNVGTSKYEISEPADFRLEIGQAYPVLPDNEVKALHAAFVAGTKNDDGAYDITRTDKWPLLAIIRGEVESQIEAGEADQRYFKTILPCQEGMVLVATVHVRKKLNFLDRVLEGGHEELYWKDQSLSNVVTGCKD